MRDDEPDRVGRREPFRTPGCATIPVIPAAASAANHRSMTGPKSAPTRPVPKRWTANSRVRITAAAGTTTCPSAGAATRTPSTADSTLIAGVISESP